MSFGDKIVSVGITISRGNLTVTQADKALTSKRITVKLYAGVDGNGDGQTRAFDDGDLDLTGVADVAGFSARSKNISASLSFVIASIDGPLLSRFAKRDGQFIIQKVEDADGAEEEEEEPNGTD